MYNFRAQWLPGLCFLHYKQVMYKVICHKIITAQALLKNTMKDFSILSPVRLQTLAHIGTRRQLYARSLAGVSFAEPVGRYYVL